jgi:hypothetical protein
MVCALSSFKRSTRIWFCSLWLHPSYVLAGIRGFFGFSLFAATSTFAPDLFLVSDVDFR